MSSGLDTSSGHRPVFRTKLGLAVELPQWAEPSLGLLKKPIWMVADGVSATIVSQRTPENANLAPPPRV